MQQKYDSVASAASAVIEIGQVLKVCADDQVELNRAAIDSAANQAYDMRDAVDSETTVMARWAFHNQARAWEARILAARRFNSPGFAKCDRRWRCNDLVYAVACCEQLREAKTAQFMKSFDYKSLIGRSVTVQVKK